MRNNYEIRAQKFIAQIFPYIEMALYEEKPYDKRYSIEFGIQTYIHSHSNRKVYCSYGVSRIALITSDYVVKIDYNTGTSFGSSYDEVEAYEYACECGFEEYFAKIMPYIYEGFTFFIMPRVNNINEDDEDVYYHLEGAAYEWVYDNFYDLHSGNYGWKNGHSVIFDYAARS